MSDTPETDNTLTTDVAEEIGAEALKAVAQATARAEFEDALRPPPAPADAEAEADTDTEDGAEDGEGDGDGEGTPNREAAKWRTKLRDTEAERDALAAQLEAMRRAAIDGHVTTMGMKPAALWASGAQLADLLGEDGTPDTAKVAAAVEAAKESLGVITCTRPRAGLQSGAMAHQPRRDKWVEAFGPRAD